MYFKFQWKGKESVSTTWWITFLYYKYPLVLLMKQLCDIAFVVNTNCITNFYQPNRNTICRENMCDWEHNNNVYYDT